MFSSLSIDSIPEPEPDPNPELEPDPEPDTGPEPDEEMHRAISGEYAEPCM